MKKIVVSILLGFLTFTALAQSFYLPVPEGWAIGELPIPPEFALQIPYTGEEHVRTAPRWREPTSETIWTYCYLWWIDGDAKISKESLQRDMQAYYAGLVNRNIISRKIEASLIVPTTASFEEITAEKQDQHTYAGTVNMLDYLSLRSITLNISVHVLPCLPENKLGVLFTVTPQAKTHSVWKDFEIIHEGFRCRK
jgi:hypothetical protein